MKLENSRYLESRQTIPVPPDGVMGHQLRRYLSLLVEGMMVAYMDTLKSVQQDVQSLELSITVTATGEPLTNESSTSPIPHGPLSAAMSPYPQDSSTLESDQWMVGQSSQTQPSENLEEDMHKFKGNPLKNCKKCKMPLSSMRHWMMYIEGNEVIHSPVRLKDTSDE